MPGMPPCPVSRHRSSELSKKRSLICFSHLRWNFVFQRPQHLLSRAAKQFNVLYFEEPVFDDNCRAHLDVRDTREGVTVITPVLPSGLCSAACVTTQRRLLNMLIESRASKLSIAWYYTPMALQFSSHLEFDCVLYDCMDELSNFKGAHANLRELEAELFARADIAFTGGHALYEAKKNKHANIHAFPSSIERLHFAKARNKKSFPDPADQINIAGPRIGFLGVIDERTDLELLKNIVEQRPAYQFIILGPVVKIDLSSLPQLPNIHFLGQKEYRELPVYLAHWDVGFMPFSINDATRFISPTKTPEFLAAGLPVVSPPVLDVVQSWGKPGPVSIAHDVETMCTEIDRALMVDHSPWLKRVDQVPATMSWDITFGEMLTVINKTLPSKTRVASASVISASVGESHV